MDCRNKRTFFNLFKIHDCGKCSHWKEDEFFFIGNTNISIYYLFRDCPQIEIEKGNLYYFSEKLKRLLLEAALHQEEIILVFLEDFELEKSYELLGILLEFGLSVQIIAG